MPKFAAGTMYRRLARPALSVFLVLKGLESGAKWEIWLVQQTLSSTDSAHRAGGLLGSLVGVAPQLTEICRSSVVGSQPGREKSTTIAEAIPAMAEKR